MLVLPVLLIVVFVVLGDMAEWWCCLYCGLPVVRGMGP